MKRINILVANLISIIIGCVGTYYYYQGSMADSAEDVISREIAILSRTEGVEIPCAELERTSGWVVTQRDGVSVFWTKTMDKNILFKVVVDSDYRSASEDVQNSCN